MSTNKLKHRIPTIQVAPLLVEDSPLSKPVSDDPMAWRNAPTIVVQLLTEAWLGWKGVGKVIEVKEIVDFNGFDYDCVVSGHAVPVIKISQRVNSAKKMSRSTELNNIQSKIVNINGIIEATELPLRQVEELKVAIAEAKKTSADKEWVKTNEDSLIGWEKREGELVARLEKLYTEKTELESKFKETESMDLSEKHFWEFKLDELD